MNTTEKNIDFQIQLWAFIGPLIALATLIVLLIKGTPNNIYLSCTLLIGTTICWKWKIRGLYTSTILLLLISTYYYLTIPPSDRLWHIGMILAILTTFAVIAFSYDEIEKLMDTIQKESASRLKNLLQLDAKLDQAQNRFQIEERAYTEKFIELTKNAQSQQKIIDLARQEILDSQNRNEKLHQEFFQLQHQLNHLHEELTNTQNQLTQTEMSMPDAASRKWAGMYNQLREQFEEKSRLLDETRRELFRVNERSLCLEREKEQTKLTLTDTERGLQKCLVELEEERNRLFNEVQELEALVSCQIAPGNKE